MPDFTSAEIVRRLDAIEASMAGHRDALDASLNAQRQAIDALTAAVGGIAKLLERPEGAGPVEMLLEKVGELTVVVSGGFESLSQDIAGAAQSIGDLGEVIVEAAGGGGRAAREKPEPAAKPAPEPVPAPSARPRIR
jgi:hypothetical protein